MAYSSSNIFADALAEHSVVLANCDLDGAGNYAAGGIACPIDGLNRAEAVFFFDTGGYILDFDPEAQKVLIKTNRLEYTAAVNPASAATDTVQDVTITVTGVVTTDKIVAIAPDDLEAGLVPIKAWVSAADTVKVRILNSSAGTVDGASKTWAFDVYSVIPREMKDGDSVPAALAAVKALAIGK